MTPPDPAGAPNAFGALRLLAAALVILGHSFVITGHDPPAWFGVQVHTLGLHVFFTISGYLITRSWQQDPSVLRYACRRMLRIMPGLLGVVLLTVGVVGPLFTRLELTAYVAAPETRLYLWNAALAPYYALPGVFQDGRPFNAVNGSLWSLPVEVAFYVLVPLLGGRHAWARAALPLAAGAACIAAFVFTQLRPTQVQPVVWWTSVPFGLRFAGDFALGALAWSWRLDRLLRLPAAAAGLAVLALLPPGSGSAAAAQLLLPYAVLAAGLRARPAPARHWRTDLSYGLYLWGCPVQQAIVSGSGAAIGPWWLTGLALGGAGLLALVSWHMLERPALLFKPARAQPVGVDAAVA